MKRMRVTAQPKQEDVRNLFDVTEIMEDLRNQHDAILLHSEKLAAILANPARYNLQYDMNELKWAAEACDVELIPIAAEITEALQTCCEQLKQIVQTAEAGNIEYIMPRPEAEPEMLEEVIE